MIDIFMNTQLTSRLTLDQHLIDTRLTSQFKLNQESIDNLLCAKQLICIIQELPVVDSQPTADRDINQVWRDCQSRC